MTSGSRMMNCLTLEVEERPVEDEPQPELKVTNMEEEAINPLKTMVRTKMDAVERNTIGESGNFIAETEVQRSSDEASCVGTKINGGRMVYDVIGSLMPQVFRAPSGNLTLHDEMKLPCGTSVMVMRDTGTIFVV